MSIGRSEASEDLLALWCTEQGRERRCYRAALARLAQQLRHGHPCQAFPCSFVRCHVTRRYEKQPRTVWSLNLVHAATRAELRDIASREIMEEENLQGLMRNN